MIESSNRPESRGPLPGAVEAVSWQLADNATRRLAQQTLEALNTSVVVERLASRYANSDNAHRAGHLFEVMHALTFNQDAIDRGASVRAEVTEWMLGGSQTAASDINLRDGLQVVSAAQAKLYNGVSGTALELSREHYQGMQRLVAGDRLESVQALLDRKVTVQPDGINVERFRDAGANMTDVLRHDDVASAPVTYDDAQAAAQNPAGWLDDEIRSAATRQLLVGVATAAGVSAAVSGLISAAQSTAKVRAGEMPVMEAVITACAAAASAAARSAAAAGIAGALQFAGATEHLPLSLGTGQVPFAVGRAAVGVAEAAFAYASGDIDALEFAARSAGVTAETGMVWAFSALGQTVLPVPVVGAMVGGFVGQLIGTQCVKGLQMAIIGARADSPDRRRLSELNAELLIAAALTEEMSELTRHLGEAGGAYVAEVVMPQVDAARHALLLEDADDVVARFAGIVASFGGTPLFSTMAEFDTWMARDEALSLDGNWR